ncbi:MAG: hypothetical protein FWC39_13515 [Bacteroidetes bacterium]|nr:hypothetical protein [Bacteroidota bacterium]
MERSALFNTLGNTEKRCGIYRTIEAANLAGSINIVFDVEELEELEARGINPHWDKTLFRKELAKQAKENGVWLDKSYLNDKELKHDQKMRGTSENDVYLNADGKTLTKVNNLSYVIGTRHDRNLNAFIDRLSAHNELFPSVAYTIKGFMYNKSGYTSMVMEQSLIDAERNATLEEISKFLTNIGFEFGGVRSWSNGHTIWSNGVYELFDARPANVLVGKDDILYFVDTIPHSVAYMERTDKY